VVERANALPFGLAVYAFTTNTQTAISTPETPFGGIQESDCGHEGGMEGLEAYTNRKFISQG
jgi:succinate-semialdehyde dehydrogenase/glutarate-semialdehyde dehydrogenase